MAAIQNNYLTLLPATTITAAVSGDTSEPILLGPDVVSLNVLFNLTYGSGGTNYKFWIQTSLDGGTTWHDIMCFAGTTASLVSECSVNCLTATGNPAARTDATLADNTANNGLLGDRVRVKYTTTGTYAGSTSVTVSGVAQRAR